jgi:dolichyl-diphosphooligosaccharide--protein glycosyltransferase
MSGMRLQNTICWILLALIFLLSLALRMAVPWEHVFVGNWIKFTDNDAYYYVRLLDNLSRHFPTLGSYDPYFIYPGGRDLAGQPLFLVYLMGFTARLLDGGAPTQHTVDLVAVFFPAVLGALLVFPVFFSGRAIFNKWAGLVAAGFIALMPGEFLVRTLLGNTDSHALEIFFSSLFMLFLLLSVHYGKSIAFYPLRSGERGRLVRPLVYSLLAGLCLGLYLLSWAGALLFVFISFTWLVLQFIIDHLHGRPTAYLGAAGFMAYLTALLISIASPVSPMVVISLAMATLSSAALAALSAWMSQRRLNTAYYPVMVVTLAGVSLGMAFITSPQFMAGTAGTLTNFFAWNPGITIAEMQPLLIQQGSFTFELVWGNYTAASVMALLALAAVIYRAFRRGEPEIVWLAVGSIITLLAALAMRRFAYYLAVNVALLAGYTGWLMLRLCGLREDLAQPETAPEVKKIAGKKTGRKKAAAAAGNPARLALGIAVVAALVIYPNTGPLPGGDKPFFDVATRALFAPSDAWCASLDWLRTNTPEPFGDAAYYYARYKPAPAAGAEARPAASYSTVCWWDYGYWVTRIGHRVPFSNPGSAQIGEQYFFTTGEKEEAARMTAGWNMRYVIVNGYMVNRDLGFKTIAGAAGMRTSRYYEIYYRQQKDKLSPTLLYYPDYYRSMAVRLYCFDGLKYEPKETAVVSWEDRTGADGFAYKEISGLKTFRSYEEAAVFAAGQKTGNWRMVGKDPLASPVPLEALEGYRLAYSSSQQVKLGTAETAEVKIFEYNP